MIPDEQLNGIPIIAVDSAAKVGTKLFFNDNAEDGAYNLTTDSTFSKDIIIEALAEYGVTCQFVSFKEWREAVFEEHGSNSMAPFASLYAEEDGDSRLYKMHSLSREFGNINISEFSSKFKRNVPEVSELVASASQVVRRQLQSHFSGSNFAKKL